MPCHFASAVDAEQLMSYLYQALAVYQDTTILAVGQTRTLPKANVCNGPANVTDQSAQCPAAKLLPTAYYKPAIKQ